MTGFLFLDKSAGITSFTAVNRVRRICNIKKAGHTGTLDPMATGVLPIMLDGATRFAQYIPVHDKAYRAKIKLGVITDSLDITGEILEERQVGVTEDEINNAVSHFVGNIKQFPPMYSAIQKDGVRLYKLARQGIEIEREARDVTIHSSDIVEFCPDTNEFIIDVSCSAGTYIRSLAADIGEALGCGATLSALRRTNANGIDISRTVTSEQLEEIVKSGKLETIISPVDEMLGCYDEVIVSDKQALRFSNGGELDLVRLKGIDGDGLRRVYSPEKKLLGLGKICKDTGVLAVEKVLVSN